MSQPKRTLRCAIYTRKSSEEGLEQDFNSLEAQREACEAYIRSQAHEGWKALPARFDDGGFSGGSLERPALQQLLVEIREKRLDVIVIYKIDRLTRSLMDFAKLADLFDQNGVSFVSVTQQFNTTTSMGRLMLNVLLSFAQFEREITGERIRDKIAASKKKGMWMGGTVPIGYDVENRKLVVNHKDAETVRTLFRLYLEFGSVRKVWAEARRLNLRTAIRVSSNGIQTGGKPFCPGNIYNLLQSPYFIGRMPHKGQSYASSHPAIIDPETWEAVQAKLAANRVDRRFDRNSKHKNPLVGILYDAKGVRFTPSHARKKGQKYRYYIDPALTTGVTPAKAHLPRIPALEIEHAVRRTLMDLLKDGPKLLEIVDDDLGGARTERLLTNARGLAAALAEATPLSWMSLVRPALMKVIVEEATLCLCISKERLCKVLLGEADEISASGNGIADGSQTYNLRVDARIRMRGGVMKLVVGNGGTIFEAPPEITLLRTIARAHDWAERLREGKVNSVREIAKEEGLTDSYLTRVIRLGFLAPVIVNLIVEGRASPDTTVGRLFREDIPQIWIEQESRIAGPSQPRG